MASTSWAFRCDGTREFAQALQGLRAGCKRLQQAGHPGRGGPGGALSSVFSFSHLVSFLTLPLYSYIRVFLTVRFSICPRLGHVVGMWLQMATDHTAPHLVMKGGNDVPHAPRPWRACFPGTVPHTSGLGPTLWLVNLGSWVGRTQSLVGFPALPLPCLRWSLGEALGLRK